MEAQALSDDPYDILGVDRDADSAVIKKAYRKQVVACHPDRTADLALKGVKREQLVTVKKAYEIIGDPVSRARYEWELNTKNLREEGERERQREERKRREDRRRQEQVERDIDERNTIAQKHLAKRAAEPQDPAKDSCDGGAKNENATPAPSAQPEKLSSVPPAQLGMRVRNPKLTEAVVDIVAVHGLGAIPDITWKDSKSGVDWLFDANMLPANAPEARILRFGYDSLWLGKEPIRTRLPTIADKLLLVLARERQESPHRPLIFIGHCFGGLVVQRALITAKLHPETETEGEILKSTIGAVFLGTPHRGTGAFGSQSALLAAIAAQSELFPAMERGVLKAVEAERGALLDVSEDFLKLSTSIKLRVSCFFEQRESNLGKMVGRSDIRQFVVDETSARLGAYRAIGLSTDHFKLNKFASPEDGNYKDVSGEVVRFYKAAIQQVNNKPSSRRRPSGELEQFRRLLAKQELRLEEAAKNAAMKEEEFEARYQEKLRLEKERAAQEEIARKKKAEEDNIERLKKNMARYGLDAAAIRRIFEEHPPPSQKHPTSSPGRQLSEEEVEEQDQWYRNSLNGALLDAGLKGGEVDAIIHDAGRTMLLDGVRVSVTRMSSEWLSERTLKRYKYPYIPLRVKSQQNPSVFIIKRWVPLYEKEFLWDHTQELRKPGSTASKKAPRNPRGVNRSTLTNASRNTSNTPHSDTHKKCLPTPSPRTRRPDIEQDHIPSTSDSGRGRESILHGRRASFESIVPPPSSEAVSRLRDSSVTLRDQNIRRRSYESISRRSSVDSVTQNHTRVASC